MANFTLKGERPTNVTVTRDHTIDIGLWGPLNTFVSPSQELEVVSDSTIIATATRSKNPIANNIRIWQIKGVQVGNVTIKAKAGSQIWDSFVVSVVPQSRSGKATFSTLDACGIAALDEILPASIRQGLEFSGLIFKQGMKFGFTSSIPGEPDTSLPLKISPPPGTQIVGTYHTHGNKAGSGEIFSFNDRGFHNLRHWTAYLGTPSSAILRFDPKVRDPNEHPGLAAFGGKAVTLRHGH